MRVISNTPDHWTLNEGKSAQSILTSWGAKEVLDITEAAGELGLGDSKRFMARMADGWHYAHLNTLPASTYMGATAYDSPSGWLDARKAILERENCIEFLLAFLSQLYDIQETLEKAVEDAEHPQEVLDACANAADDIRSLGEEAQESLDNMPEGLQQGSTGEMLQNRIDRCEEMADELEGVSYDEDDWIDTSDEEELVKLYAEDTPRVADETDEDYKKAATEWAEEQNSELLDNLKDEATGIDLDCE